MSRRQPSLHARVNTAFTIGRYARGSNDLRRQAMSIITAIWRLTLALLALAYAQVAGAQTTITADWTNLGLGDNQAVTSGTALAAGPNSVTVTTRVNRDGDSNDAGFVPDPSSEVLSYTTAQVGSQTGSLLYGMDHSIFDVGDYFESTYTLATAVSDLTFTVANLSRLGFSFWGFESYNHDAVVVEYDTGDGIWRNLRSLPGAYVLGSGVATTTIGGQQGFHGTANTGQTSTNGDIRVDFGATTVKRVRIRYLFGQDFAGNNPSGGTQYIGLSDFTWTQAGVTASDLSLTGSISSANPASGSNVTYTLNLLNSGPQAAANVTVRDMLPPGATFVSSSGYGSYDSATGLWSIPTISSGQTRSLTIVANVGASAGATIVNTAQVHSSPNYDTDSTPANSNAGEDDQVAISFTVQGTRTAGTAPVLSCPANSSLFDWDVRAWAAGSLNNSYAVTGIGSVNFAVSSTGTWVNDAAFGGMSPTLSNQNNGGFAGTQLSLHQYLDFAGINETATTVITLPTAVPGAQFTVFDIDYAANDFADKLTVTGSFNGTSVTPTLTNGISNYVIGNTAYGDGASGGTAADGNVVVTFTQPVDIITIVYGNHSMAPANPDGQAIGIYDITFCNPVAVLGVTKVSTLISDPVNGTTNPRAMPGAIMEYCILVQNPGSGTATNVIGTDTIPAALTYTVGSMLSGPTCGGATTAEDEDAAGADDSDPFGASVSGTVLTATAASLAPGAGFALKFRTTIK